jgi:glycosyltransferase involved in cell wall biosynthesis
MWDSVAAYRTAAATSLADLSLIRDHGPLERGSIVAATVVRNERSLVSSFLAHYRSLGVSRFLIVDNGSSDGTLDIIKAAPDVDLWTTSASYAAANQGRLWIDGLLWSRARRRWILQVDADEFLVFVGMYKGGLRRLIGQLEWRRQRRLFAPMLDVYSDQPIRDTTIEMVGDPLSICNWFDGDAESTETNERGKWVVGGARRRLFFADEPERAPLLSKYPLVYYDKHTTFVDVHTPSPYRRNFLKPYGRLLHIKLHSGFDSGARRAVAEKQHWENSIEYRRYLEVLSASPQLKAHFPKSRRYDGPESVIAAGFMRDPKLCLRDVVMGIWRWY